MQVKLRYAATVPAVAAMLADPAYGHARVVASGAVAHQVDVAATPDGAFTVTTRRSMPTDQIPANFRSFVGSSLDVRQVEVWEAGSAVRHGTVVVEITGAPVRLTGTTTIEADDASLAPGPAEQPVSILTYDGDVRAAVPLFGAAIEEAAARAVRAALEAEQIAGNRWLESHPRDATA